MQESQLAKYSFVPQFTMHSNFTSSMVASKKSIVIIQSREGIQQDTAATGTGDAKPSKSAAPPPTPRPCRLPTPELSDIDEERPFCDCEALRKVPIKCQASCRRMLL
jgi:hypothetical protein